MSRPIRGSAARSQPRKRSADSMRTRSTTILLTMLLGLIPITPLFSQLDTATISGRVTDASGAVVPGAQVTVVNTETNFENVTLSNADGLYRVPTLRPGPYRIEVKLTGFKTYVRDSLELRVGDNLAVNAALEVGGTSETVKVTGEAPQLQTETSSIGAVLEGKYLQDMPLYQRNVKATFYLMYRKSTRLNSSHLVISY